MASEVRFDRDAVGIKAQTAWTDNQMFINIADGIGELSLAAVSGVTTLPIDTVDGVGRTDNDGIAKLSERAGLLVDTMRSVTLEFSDACSTLGSGAETAIGNMDAAESQVTQDFAFMMSSKPQ